MDYEQYDLWDLKDDSLTIPAGAYTISSGQVLIVWYDKDNNRHVNGMGVATNE